MSFFLFEKKKLTAYNCAVWVMSPWVYCNLRALEMQKRALEMELLDQSIGYIRYKVNKKKHQIRPHLNSKDEMSSFLKLI